MKNKLLPYQEEAVKFFVDNNGKGLLADEMGLGKTAMSLSYSVHEKFDKILVICPASVKYSFENEVKKWTKLKPLVIDSRSKLTIKDFNENNIFIINYDILKKFYDFLVTVRLDCLIVDECHYTKNIKSQRSKLLKMISMKIPSLVLLSGTPFLNRPVELFSSLNILDPKAWPNWFQFTKRYCNGHYTQWGWDTSGASNIDELREKIKPYFLRRTKSEVLPQLPPKRYIDIPTELNGDDRFTYDLILTSFMQYLHEVKNKTDKEIKKSMQAEKLVRLGELRKITSMSKVATAEEIITNVVNGGEKIVVFSSYNEPLEILYEKFGKQAVLLTGQTPEMMRKLMIENFQKKDDIKIFLGGIKSAGVGITLTAASTVLFIDYSWVPGDHNQAEDRTHRYGQEAESITIFQLYAKNTIDEKMKNILVAKKKIFDQLIEGHEIDKKISTSVVSDLIGDLSSSPLDK